MLRIHVETEQDEVRMRLEGKLIDPWADELMRVWMDVSRRIHGHSPLRVDLSAVSFVDARGKAVLAAMRRSGCLLQGPTPFIEAVLNEVDFLFKD